MGTTTPLISYTRRLKRLKHDSFVYTRAIPHLFVHTRAIPHICGCRDIFNTPFFGRDSPQARFGHERTHIHAHPVTSRLTPLPNVRLWTHGGVTLCNFETRHYVHIFTLNQSY